MSVDLELERSLLGEGGPSLRTQVRERLRHDAQARQVYDDYFTALELLEQGSSAKAASPEEAHFSLSAEEQEWLAEGFFQARARVTDPAPRVAWRSWLPWVFAAAATFLLVAVWQWGRARGEGAVEDRVAVAPPLATATGPGAGLVARGRGRQAELEFEIFCGPELAPVNDGRCALDEEMNIAARATGSRDYEGARSLTLFGVDEAGRVQYYLPTPVDAAGLALPAGAWEMPEHAVRLEVNHRAGQLRIFGLLAPRTARVEEVDAMAELLREAPDAPSAAGTWIDLIARRDAELAAQLCPESQACEAVYTELRLDPKAQP